MPATPSLIDASLFHRQLRLHVGGVDHPHLRASLVALTCRYAVGARPLARLSFVCSAAEQASGDLTHALRTIPLGTEVDIAQVGDDGQPLSLFAGTVTGRGLHATDAGAPQAWIACEGVDDGEVAEGRAVLPLTYGGHVTALSLGEYDEAAGDDALAAAMPWPAMRGEVQVVGWLAVLPGDDVELRSTGSVFDGPVRVRTTLQRFDAQGTSSTLTVQRTRDNR